MSSKTNKKRAKNNREAVQLTDVFNPQEYSILSRIAGQHFKMEFALYIRECVFANANDILRQEAELAEAERLGAEKEAAEAETETETAVEVPVETAQVEVEATPAP